MEPGQDGTVSVVLSIAAITAEELNYRTYRTGREVARLMLYAVGEGLGYRQLNDVWRTIAYVDIARGKKSWGAQERRGFAAADDTAAGEE